MSKPPGYSTIGPIFIDSEIKQEFIKLCKKEGVTMEDKIKGLILSVVPVPRKK